MPDCYFCVVNCFFYVKLTEIGSNMVKRSAHRSAQRFKRQTRKDDVCRENSLKEGLSLFAICNKLKSLHMIGVYHVRHRFSTRFSRTCSRTRAGFRLGKMSEQNF